MAGNEQKDVEKTRKAVKAVKKAVFEAEEPKTGLAAADAFGDLPEGVLDARPLPFDINALLRARAEIDARLPASKLADLDLETEVVLQYQQTKQLLLDVLGGSSPANQKAQVANSCASILDQLIKMQARLYSAERLKAIEAALIKTLKTLPQDTQEAFFVQYERNYEPAAA